MTFVYFVTTLTNIYSFFQFNKNVLNALKTDIDQIIEDSDNVDLKEIKGLGDRLYGLEQLMVEAKRYVQEQSELAQSFLQVTFQYINLRLTFLLVLKEGLFAFGNWMYVHFLKHIISQILVLPY